MTIGRMSENERAAVHALLRSHKLPLDGFDAAHVEALVAREAGRVVGSAALELFGSYGLLRSVAVEEGRRRRGVGNMLTAAALDLARSHQVREIYLLTETAAGFFPRHGFERVGRDAVPAEVRASVEFTTACAVTAEVMRRRL